MSPEDIAEILEETGAILKGHFRLSSGRHSDLYVEKFRALEKPLVAAALGSAIAERHEAMDIDVVLAPAMGAIVLGAAAALALARSGSHCRSIIAERQEGQMVLRRGFEISPGERVLVIEDVITTGKSLKEVLKLVSPGILVGISCLLNRSGQKKYEHVEVDALATIEAPSWEITDCPLCAQGGEAVAPGSRFIS